LADVRKKLRHKAAGLKWTVAVQLAVGLLILLIGPCLLASVYVKGMDALIGRALITETTLYWILVLVLTPLLFRMEIKTRGRYYNDAVMEAGSPSGGSFYLGSPYAGIGFIAANPRQAAAGFVELLLLGPRLVLEAFQKVHHARLVKSANLDRAAEVLCVLNGADHAMLITQLQKPGEQLAGLVPTLAYLLFHDWIGMSKKGDKVWIGSDAKAALFG
jgi:hypothetical protein